jgi:hypothetical protein
MSLPTKRLTVTLAEHNLLKPGLDLLANGLATAKLGSFPHRHPWHRIDLIASDVYRDQEFDAEMSARIIRARRKLCDQTQSRKVYLDALELAALAFALRLSRSKKLVDVTETVSTEMVLLASKLETYRKRAKRAAVAQTGTSAYQSIAGRWRRNVEWLQFNALYTRVPNNLERGRARGWREQRQQTTQAIKAALAQKFYEAPSDKHMDRIVTLLTTSLRRCRYRLGLVGVLLAPQEHTDFIVGFVVKRLELNRLPGAPVPAWQAMSDRAEKFREHQLRTRGRDVLPCDAVSETTVPEERRHLAARPIRVKAPRPFTHHRQLLTEETLIDAMVAWLYQAVTMNFNLTREICAQARYQILHGHIDQYRVEKLAATSFNGVVQELRPTDEVTDTPDVISAYAGWLLGILLALRQHPAWIYGAIETIGTRAVQREQEARNVAWTARMLNRS